MPQRHIRVQARVRVELVAGVAASRVDLGERLCEPTRVPGDQRLSELGLAREVVVEARLRHGKLRGDVRVAEAVESPGLDEPLRDIEDVGRGIALRPTSLATHRQILTFGTSP